MFKLLWKQMIETLRKTPLSLLPLTSSLGIGDTNILGTAKKSLTFCWPSWNEQVLISAWGKFFQSLRSLNVSVDCHHSSCDGLRWSLDGVTCFLGDFCFLIW